MVFRKLQFKNFREFKEFYSDRWVMPKEFKSLLAKRNLHNILIILHFTFLYGLIGLLGFFAIHHGELHNLEIYRRCIYYLLYIGFSIFDLILTVCIHRFCRNNTFVKNLPLYLAIAFFVTLDIMLFSIIKQPFQGTILYACIGMVIVIFFNVSPVIYLVMSVYMMAHVGYFVVQSYGYLGIVDFVLMTMLLFFMGMFKWRITKKDLIKTELLDTHRKALREEVDAQSDALQKQHEKIIEIQNNTIISLSNLVENRDSDTGEHVRRTSAYVRLLAQKAYDNSLYQEELTPEYIELLTKAAPMHDIGKIVVPDSVLKKPGKLDAEEFEQIKKHTTEGGRIVREILGENEDQKYVILATEVASGHHERWDGTGYPLGLTGLNIPLSARIMAIADVYDALVSPRCYKEPFTVEEAFNIIKEGSGTHFDPKLTELFLQLRADIETVMNRYRDN